MSKPTEADVGRARAWLIMHQIPTSGLALSLAAVLADARADEAAALAKACEEGRSEERRACCAEARRLATSFLTDSKSAATPRAVDLIGRSFGAAAVCDAIAARGPMEGSHE